MPDEQKDLCSSPNQTPFHMDLDWESRLENTNRNCTHAEIDTLISKGIVGAVDLEIMRLLGTYKFLNAYNIQYHLNNLSSLNKHYKKPTYTSNLKKLTKAGILARYRFIHPCDSSKEVTGLSFYDLTAGSYSYIAPVIAAPYFKQTRLEDPRKMELLALNQFLLRTQYACENMKLLSYLTWHKMGAKAFCIDAIVRSRAPSPIPGLPNVLFLFPLPVRYEIKWKAKAASRFSLYSQWIAAHSDHYPLALQIAIVETLDMATELYAYICSTASIQHLPFYFVTDRTVMDYPLWDCIFSCRTSEDGDTIITRHKLSQKELPIAPSE